MGKETENSKKIKEKEKKFLRGSSALKLGSVSSVVSVCGSRVEVIDLDGCLKRTTTDFFHSLCYHKARITCMR